MENRYKEVIEQFITESELDFNNIHHAELVKEQPEYDYYIEHRKGEEIHTWFYKIFGFESIWRTPEYYPVSILANKWNKKYHKNVVEAENEFSEKRVQGKYVWRPDDVDHPVWFANGLLIYETNKYGNISPVCHLYHINWFTLDECKAIVDYINEYYAKNK